MAFSNGTEVLKSVTVETRFSFSMLYEMSELFPPNGCTWIKHVATRGIAAWLCVSKHNNILSLRMFLFVPNKQLIFIIITL